MPKAYIVITYHSVSDPEKLVAYGKLAIPTLAAFNGRFLTRGTAAAAFERGLRNGSQLLNFRA